MSVALPIPRARTLSIMPTYRCTAACKNCGTLSSPHAKACLTVQEITSVIDEGHEANFRVVVFTGGEATLEMEPLVEGIKKATGYGMVTRLVTNAHWAIDEEAASSFITLMKRSGLSEINFSTGDQHARWVPMRYVLTAVRESLREGFVPAVMIETTATMTITREVMEADEYHKETRSLFPGRRIHISESPWMPLNPRKAERYSPGMAVDATNLSRTQGCDSVLQTTTVQADGNIGACCGLGMRLIPELNLGRVGETTISAAIDEGEEDLLKQWIHVEGPEKILAWASQRDPSIEWEGIYAHRCQACLRLYKDNRVRAVIKDHIMEKVPDILFTDYLLHGLNTTSLLDPETESEGRTQTRVVPF